MTNFLIEYANLILSYVSTFALLLYPMWKMRSIKTSRPVILFLIGNVLFLGAVLLCCQQIWGMDFEAFQMFKLLAGPPTLIMPFFVFRKNTWQIIFFISMCFVYNLIPTGISNYAADNWFSSWAYPLQGANIVCVVITVLTLPPILSVLKRLCENPNMKQAAIFWKLIWLLPAVFCLIIVMTSSYIDGGSVKGYGFIIVRVLVYGALMLICFLLDAAVRQISEIEAAKRREKELAAKNDFYYKMSHALLTPLTEVSTNVQLAKTEPEDAAELLAKSQEEIMKMAKMINDALESRDGGEDS